MTVTELDPPAVRPPPPDDGPVHCRRCDRPLAALTSQALHLGPGCFARLVGDARGRVTAVHAGQLVLDLDEDHETDRSAGSA